MSEIDLHYLFKDIKSIELFRKRFSTEHKCLEMLADLKWKDGFVCCKCGHTHYCEGKTPYSRRCTKCKADESATAHTLFHHCRLRIMDAFELAYRVCCSPDISSYELSREMSTRQMTCWKFKKRIQEYQEQIAEDQLTPDLLKVAPKIPPEQNA